MTTVTTEREQHWIAYFQSRNDGTFRHYKITHESLDLAEQGITYTKMKHGLATCTLDYRNIHVVQLVLNR